ncbi:hypothetical protein LPJ66_008279 [Kickxella alabastrina]|uniref:Uncharacterized protein n=1 Tax=Kickxella alabastrina TaxID=61397 RepID=A0ACC1I745_9FUNG|nr:hypothetical protein LPJ66_008279 [Kickxella alabastrina]
MTVAIGIGSIIFNICNSMVQGMVGFDGVLGLCRLWGVWGLFTFGLGVLLSAINMRMVLFYRVFITVNSTARSNSMVVNFFRKFWPFFALWTPTIVTGIVMSSLKSQQGVWLLEDQNSRDCIFANGYLYWIYAYFILSIVLSWVIYLRMRRVARVFNGFRTAIWTVVIATVALAVSIVIKFVKGSNSPWGRIAIGLTNTILLNGYIWFMFAPPVIGHIFWREQTMRDFMNTLHKDSLIVRQKRSVEMQSGQLIRSKHEFCASSTYSNRGSFNDDILKQENMEAPQFELHNPMPVFESDPRRTL